MKGFGVHTSMWAMNWTASNAEIAVREAARFGMDFIEIALLDPPMVDAAHTRALLEKAGTAAVCSLGLPEPAWASVRPDAAIAFLEGAIAKTADLGGLALSGMI